MVQELEGQRRELMNAASSLKLMKNRLDRM